ncbi:hypothetical protein [Tuwongella immobilis]|uniref:Uncharacterized protein n=1 Tax=Tuwongella immobilis TaxID=692036 RepID=A0A6C2YS56_9BACT|nr:hypothetical protein [Tuwongella immobilis]VIP04191.1 unnamed protein product [Tuwongella immobilis]VTS05746.1 unnamed protein product [Tuwongella immobilis]
MSGIRHPLGLPEGSVRALLALQICLQYWLLMLLPESIRVPVPLYLYFLLSVIFLFFVSRSRVSGANPNEFQDLQPLGIPAGLFRILLLGVTIGLTAYKYSQEGEAFLTFLTPKPEQLTAWPTLGIALVTGFTLGYFLRLLPVRDQPFVLTIQAWLSLIAMFMLVLDLVYQTFIQPGMQNKLTSTTWEAVIVAMIAFYFASRS